jgi:flagellar basal-body rod protein FlgB
MAISFQNALGIHEHALQFRAKRTEVLASNLVNSDTPNYKARDIDFAQELKRQQGLAMGGLKPAATRSGHIGHGNLSHEPQLMYRIPNQPSIDGNTVEEQEELARYAKNSMDFQASFQFLNSKFKGLQKAIRGE